MIDARTFPSLTLIHIHVCIYCIVYAVHNTHINMYTLYTNARAYIYMKYIQYCIQYKHTCMKLTHTHTQKRLITLPLTAPLHDWRKS